MAFVNRYSGRGAPTAAATWDALVDALRAYGVRHLTRGDGRWSGPPPPPEVLVDQLARSGDPRLRQAIIPLLLSHPSFADAARHAIEALPPAERDRARRAYVAAAALQRMWRTRLELALGPQPLIPPAYLDEFCLPPLDRAFGEDTLWALAADEEARYGHNAWAGYRTLAEQVLAEMAVGNWGARA